MGVSGKPGPESGILPFAVDHDGRNGMPLTTSQLVSGLGAGQSLAEIAGAAGVSVEEARKLWQTLIRAKVPPSSADVQGVVGAPVEVVRDSYGVPHVYARSEPDLFFGLGFAMAQDRSWQM